MILIAFVIVVLLIPTAFIAGVKVAQRHQIDYKKRWLEATKLLGEERIKTGLLDGVDKPKPKAALPVFGGTGKWKLDTEYKPGGEKATFFAVRGEQRVRISSVSWPMQYPARFENTRDSAIDAIDIMNDG